MNARVLTIILIRLMAISLVVSGFVGLKHSHAAFSVLTSDEVCRMLIFMLSLPVIAGYLLWKLAPSLTSGILKGQEEIPTGISLQEEQILKIGIKLLAVYWLIESIPNLLMLLYTMVERIQSDLPLDRPLFTYIIIGLNFIPVLYLLIFTGHFLKLINRHESKSNI